MYYPRGNEMLTNGNQTTVWRPMKSREIRSFLALESESELFTGDTSKDNHSPGPVFREVSP